MAETLTATLQTNQGRVVVRLFPDHAPKTVRNFVELAEGSRQWTDPSTGQATSSRHGVARSPAALRSALRRLAAGAA